MATATVHTTGINWTSVLVIVGSSVTILAGLGSMTARYVSGRIAESITQFQIRVVTILDNRLTAVETILKEVNEHTEQPEKQRRGRGRLLCRMKSGKPARTTK